MGLDDVKDKAKKTANNVKNSAKKAVDDPTGEMAKSGKDWLSYIQTHPIQSMLFGLIGYFAIKGMFK